MATKGNMHIKEAKKYDNTTRKKITDLILREFKTMEKKDPNGMTFAAHMLKVLTAAGFNSPDGSPLTIRGIRYQVLRSGIGFQGARTVPEPIVDKNAPQPAPKAVEPSAKADVMASLSKIPALLENILRDESVSPSQRVSLVKAWFEVEK